MRASPSRGGLFLMELILVTLCFALSAAVCLRVFVAAKLEADRSRDLSAAALAAQNAAECWKAAGGDPARCAALLHAAGDGDTLVQGFDADWRPTQGAARCRLYLRAEDGAAVISVLDAKGEELFSLRARVPAGGAP